MIVWMRRWIGQALGGARLAPAASIAAGNQPIGKPTNDPGCGRELQGVANRRNVSCVFKSYGNIGAVIRRQRDQRAADAVIKKVAQVRGFRDHDHH